jgi:3'(2'), 5'-bisphosphate nucleotidase
VGRPRELEVGLEAVRVAARLCEAVRQEMVAGGGAGKLDKEDRSPVTVADFGAQALVCKIVGEAFPADVIVAEESSAALQAPGAAAQLSAVTRYVNAQVGETSEETVCSWIDRGEGTPAGRFWVLDPIDGTKGFLRNDQYAVALALVVDGQVQWGFLGCPVLPHDSGRGVLFVARRGGGAEAMTLVGESLGRIRVSDTSEPAQARLAESVVTAHTNRGLSGQVQESLGVQGEPVRLDSQAKYGVVARGQADIYLRAPNSRTPDYRENIWDHAAGALVVEEAGGKVTDVYGEPLDWTTGRRLERNRGVLATNGRLHEAVVDALAPLLPPR